MKNKKEKRLYAERSVYERQIVRYTMRIYTDRNLAEVLDNLVHSTAGPWSLWSARLSHHGSSVYK